MKRIVVFALALALAVGTVFGGGSAWAAEEVTIDAVHFPDDAFRACVSVELDGNGDGVLSKAERRITTLDVSGRGIASLQGLEFFPKIETLRCEGNALTKLNVKGNARLVELHCDDNRIRRLKLDGCGSLETLSCEGNQLKALDVSGCPALKSLACARNAIKRLDVTGCAQLETLSCDENRLKALDVSDCAALKELTCARNRLTTLDMSGNPALESLRCPGNRIKRLDIHANAALTVLECWDNRIGFFDISTLSDGLRALASDDALRVVEADKLYWRATAPMELSLPPRITLSDGGKIIYGRKYTEMNLANAVTGDRRDYPQLTDAEFANFRNVATTGMGHNALYRSSTPLRTSAHRNREALAATEAAGIRTILNISDDESVMKRIKGYRDSYYAAQNVLAKRAPNSGSLSPARMRIYVEHFRYMIAHEGPYLVHCINGKDRTGSVCALLECLMGATADEVFADYMVTYYNYCGVAPGTEVYDYILKKRIRHNLRKAFKGVDIAQPGVRPAACAEALLLRSGMTRDEIAALKARLAKDY